MIADYIKCIEIDALWNGKRHIKWELRPDVNILSGVNGVGKSTILNHAVATLLSHRREKQEGVRITLSNEDADGVRLDVIRSFDRPIVHSDVLNQFVETKINSELDLQLYQLQRRYLDYQVNASNRIVALFTSGAPDAQQQAQLIAGEKAHFQDLVDDLFSETGKKIIRDRNEIFFVQMGEELPPYKLSSGEKQMLIILLTALVENREHYVLFMDEPEISLHVDWQQRLIALIRDLNPNAQIILTTHSPAVVMDGWMDCVTDVEDVIVHS
ncbi:MAG: ATP-binding protein [Bacteroidales bacterium]|nr:ATP-binding protein [Candidatus Physcousia equi]